MKALLAILVIIPITAFGQIFGEFEVAIIRDDDGYTLIRKGPDLQSEIVDTLFEGEFFQYIKSDTTNWYRSYKMWNISGYVHKSRIQNIKFLKNNDRHKLIDSILDLEISLYSESMDSKIIERGRGWYHHEEKFIPILDLFIEYMCLSYDDALMRKFLDLLIIESGSADESPPTALGYIHQCQPKLVNSLIDEYKYRILSRELEFGKRNIENKN